MGAKALSRLLVNRFLVRSLPRPFHHVCGDCWSSALPMLTRWADDATHPQRSSLALYEDGVPLQQAHSPVDEIASLGIGRYRHWGTRLLFSTTDNSDPNTNGRHYTYSISPWLYKRRVARPETDPAVPHNLRKRDANPERIRADVRNALEVGRHYLNAIRRLGESPAGKTILEVGPGINYGCSVFLAAYGAKPLVLDRFLAPWECPYHPRFYAQLLDELRRTDPAIDVRPVLELLEADGYPESVIRRNASPLEDVPLASNSVDMVISNAVVEHLSGLERSFAQLFRITKPGGYGLHQVDFRDHRNFDRPLEYLLLDDAAFWATFERCHTGCGNRFRPEEVSGWLRAAGFEIVSFEGSCSSKAEYLQQFVPRLRKCNSRYQNWPEESLRTVSGFYVIRKPKN